MRPIELGALSAALATLALGAPPTIAQARPATDTVQVVALRTDQGADETGTAVAVISAADIERRGLVFATDALASAPGVTVSQAGAWGGVASVRIRGNAAGQTLVLVDGTPVNDAASPGGAYDFGALDVFGIDRIEMLRGPQSTLWGGDAIGGVVSIVTADAPVGLDWRAFAEAGSYETLRAGASLGGGTARARGRLGVSWTASEGISKADKRDGAREPDGYESTSAMGRGTIQLAEGARVDGSFRWSASDAAFDGFPPPAFVLADTNERQESEEASGGAALHLNSRGGRFGNTLEVSASRLDRSTFLGDAGTGRNLGEREVVRYLGRIAPARGHDLRVGAEYEQTQANGEEAEAKAVFALYSLSPVDRLDLSFGLRNDEDDRYGSETTGRATASWRISPAVRVRASWGQGFKPPTLFQTTFICTFCGLSAPSRDLKAETSEATDAGVDVRFGKAMASLTWFQQDTDNLIDFDFARGYANIAKASQTGVEAELSTPLGPWFEARASYAYIDAEDGFGQPLPRVPEHSGTAELILAPGTGFTGSLAVRHNGRQSDGFGPDVAAWTRWDLAGSYAFRSGLEIYGRIENLTGEAYQQVGGYGTPGLSGFLGVRVHR